MFMLSIFLGIYIILGDRNRPQYVDISNLSPRSPITDICNIFGIPKAGSEPVISFFNRANPFNRVCLFCIFVTNTIYVVKIEMLEPVSMARYRKF